MVASSRRLLRKARAKGIPSEQKEATLQLCHSLSIQQLRNKRHRENRQHKPTDEALDNGEIARQTFNWDFPKTQCGECVDGKHEGIQHFDKQIINQYN